MAYFLFIDESGSDRHEAPYEVLAGVVLGDADVWNLILDLQGLEEELFGVQYRRSGLEIKAKKLLKRKTFRLANQCDGIPHEERRLLARNALLSGSTASKRQLAALAQAKLDYVCRALELCIRYRAKAFAVAVEPSSPRPTKEMLRKDYVYLFERFFYFLEDAGPREMGIIIFDEVGKNHSHLLLDQMEKYFKMTEKGRLRCNQVIPEPLFVQSDLSTGIRLADLIAYLVSWGYRIPGKMRATDRPE